MAELRRALAVAGLLFAAGPLPAALPESSPRPGGIVVIDLGPGTTAPEVRFDGRRVLTVQDGGRWHAIVGIPLDQPPGAAALSVAGDPAARRFEVRPHAYREQRLSVAPSYVNPPAETLERIARESERIGNAIAHYSAAPPVSALLAPPVPGRRSDSFGSRRVFNDEPRAPHRGMDISGGSGTPVTAPLAGVVIESGEFYFTGNAVFLDHGQGLVTLYAHLERIEVATGDRVAAGDRLGTVGATGRVTGAHLHFATYLNGTPVDPALLLVGEAASP